MNPLRPLGIRARLGTRWAGRGTAVTTPLRSRLVDVVAGAALALLLILVLMRGWTHAQGQSHSPWGELAGALQGMGVMAGLGLLLLVAVELVDRSPRRLDPEHTRKLAHVGAGLIGAAAPWLFSSHWPMLVLSVGFVSVLLVSRSLGLLTSLNAGERRSAGDVLMPIALYVAFLLADGDATLYLLPVLILIFSDPAAALVGRRTGRLGYVVLGNPRTLEGSAAFAISAYAIAVVVLSWSTYIEAMPVVLAASIVTITATVLEAVSPRGLDNLYIPVGTLLVLDALARL